MESPKRWWMSAVVVLAGVAFLGWEARVSHLPDREGEGGASIMPVPFRGRMLQVGEELEYEVSYSFFHIGSIRIKVVDREERNGKVIYKSLAFIDSNPSLSWLVDLHIRFYSEMDEGGFSHSWISDDSTEKEINFRKFNFDYENNRVLCETGKRLPTGERRVDGLDTVSITDRCQDGLSLFFYARENLRQNREVQVPTLIEKKPELTFINFRNKRTSVEIDAVEYPVEVLEFDGKADYVGVFGLTGGFRGWFSNDEANVPIFARMNVILGSIRIELTKWNRTGWQPPRFVEEAGR